MNNFVIRLLFLTALILNFGCSDVNSNKKNKSVNYKNKSEKSDSINPVFSHRDSLLSEYRHLIFFSYKKIINNGIYSLEIETFCKNDTLPSNEDPNQEDGVLPITTTPIIIEQKLTFVKEKEVVKTINLPIKKSNRKNYIGKKVVSAEQNIWLIYVLKGTKKDCFGIAGSGLCNGSLCPEFAGFYSMNGEVIYQGADSNDNINNTFSKYGITDNDFKSGRKNGVRVDIFWEVPNK